NWDTSPEWARADFDVRHRGMVAGTMSPNKWLNIGLVFSASTGAPYNITTGRDSNGDSLANDRPPGVRRNSGQGPGLATLDLRWSRNIPLDRTRKDKGPT